jgi:Flp pilus assembly protein TadD
MEAKHEEAQALYRQALRASPDDPAISNDLALSLMLQGRVRDAIAVLQPLQDTMALPQQAKATLALLYALDGQPDRSRQVLGRDLPNDYVAQVAKAVAGGQPLVAPAVSPAM